MREAGMAKVNTETLRYFAVMVAYDMSMQLHSKFTISSVLTLVNNSYDRILPSSRRAHKYHDQLVLFALAISHNSIASVDI